MIGERLSERGKAAVVLGGIFLVTLLAYARSFHGEFQFDDYHFLANPNFPTDLRGLSSWARTRMLPTATLMLNLRVGGENPFGFHVFNFAVHLVCTFFVFQLVLALCRTPRLARTRAAESALAFAAAAAALFALHPIEVQAVTYITQRTSLLAATFYVGSVLFYVRARTAQSGGARGHVARSFSAAAAFAVAALLSKESVITLPAAILLVEWFGFGTAALRRRAFWIPALLVVVALATVWLALALGGQRRPAPVGGAAIEAWPAAVTRLFHRSAEGTGRTAGEYFVTQLTVLPRYLRLVLLPWGLNVDHDVPIQQGLSFAAVAGGAFLLALLGFALAVVRRFPFVALGILWFFVASSVESSFIPIRDLMNEHRMYLAMPGIALALGSAFVLGVRRRPVLGSSAGLVIAVGLAALTFQRNGVWLTQRSLWADAVAKSPDKARPHVNYGTALHLDDEIDAAIEQYCRALEIEPKNVTARANLAMIQEALIDEGELDVVMRALPDGTSVGVARDPCKGRRKEAGGRRQ